jgi:tRNA 2-thiouridine synthesizing protein E
MAGVAGSDSPTGDPNRQIRQVAGRRIIFDAEGFFWNPEDWTEEVARTLARECGLEELTAEHWRVLHFLRDYFFDQGRAPLNRQLKAGVGMSMMELEALFPAGIKHGARRLAGLPNPRTCT